ncbi:WXG100 family type VII secretion target [Streptomyces sp. MRC013]|uniref:WXG100 family type VII secretion target n=1 Tax=Streptomyces sp. MRC013 TaxID=2898276 RepID=UPI002025F709|nr:WXG100 family type VII secretion target [Streptomyces sp. MRC013]URM89405.1 WXG100 family type VII secretion target [Streptomyces sp. MRC013]
MTQNDGTMIVTYSSLQEAAGNIEKQAERLNTSLEAIQAKIASISDLWEGEAREAYKTAQTDWDRRAMEIHKALNQIARAVREAAPAYQQGDKKAASNFM